MVGSGDLGTQVRTRWESESVNSNEDSPTKAVVVMEGDFGDSEFRLGGLGGKKFKKCHNIKKFKFVVKILKPTQFELQGNSRELLDLLICCSPLKNKKLHFLWIYTPD